METWNNCNTRTKGIRISLTIRNIATYINKTTGQIRGQGEKFQNLNWPRGEHYDNYKPFVGYSKTTEWNDNMNNTTHVEGSTFTAYARMCKNKCQLEIIQEEIRKKHPNACHAPYVWNAENSKTETDDDGEPVCKHTNRSVCDKMLETILKNGYEDIIIVIAREWNGNKLGLTKLQNAYENATKEIICKSNKNKETTIHKKTKFKEMKKESRREKYRRWVEENKQGIRC